MPVIDMRFRPPSKEFKQHFQELIPVYGLRPGRRWVSMSLEECVREMEEQDLVGVLLGHQIPATGVANDHVKEVADKYPGRFLPVAGVDASPANLKPAQAEVERVARVLKFKGIHVDYGKLEPPLFPDDPRLYPLYFQCQELGLFVGLRTGPLAGPTLEYTSPLKIERVALDFPRLQIVLLHGCFPYIRETMGVMIKCPNVWCSPDVFHTTPGHEDYTGMVNHAWWWSDRMLYGSAWPYGPGWREHLDLVKKLPLKLAGAEKYFYQNAARLFGLQP